MKKIIFIMFMVVALSALSDKATAQPSWSVNPGDYAYSMTITGQLITKGYISSDENDMVAAFMDGECCGLANVKDISSANGYYVFLMVYGNSTSGTITFKFYDASEGEELDAAQTLNFTQNDIVGSASNPFLFSESELSSEAEMLSFSVPDQEGETLITGNSVSLQIPWDGNLTNLVASFSLSEGAKAYIGDVEQESGVTANNFTNTVEYTVQSADMSTSTVYSVDITNANDIPTDITLSNNTAEENKESLVVGVLKAVTEDPTETHVFSLENLSGAENWCFSIKDSALMVKRALDYEDRPSYNVCVKADDQKGGTVSKFFTVNVIDVNEAPTGVALINTDISVNVEANSTIGELKAIDEDEDDTHTFSLVTGDGTNDADNGLFYIDGNKLKNSSELSFVNGKTYNIYVRAVDSGNKSFDAAMVISMENTGTAPVNLTLSNTLVVGIENPPLFVGTLSVSDADQETGHVYTLPEDAEDGPDNACFSITDNSLYIDSLLSVDEKDSYDIMVTATDSMGNQVSETFTVTVREKGGTGAFFLTNDSLSENQAANTVVGYFDSDDLECSGFTFSLPLEVDLGKYGNNYFEIKGRTLLSTKSFDYEEDSEILLRLSATDGDTTIWSDITVFLKDENDPPTSLSLSTQILSESTVIESEVALLSTEDQDSGDTHTFSLIVGNGINDASNSYFSISGDKLVLEKALDYETQEYHRILIRVTDAKGGTFEQGFRLKIVDANDAPEFQSESSGYVLQDDVYVYEIKVTDNENDSISINFEDLPEWLEFNDVSGILSGIPGNSQVGTYSFSIVASDGKKQTVQEVILSVINKNDAPEVNYYLEAQVFYLNCQNSVQLPADCISDPDNDTLKYSLSMENNSALPEWLNFDSESLVMSGMPPDDGTTAYSLKLTASDEGKLYCSIVFSLSVANQTDVGVEHEMSEFGVYPNPVTDVLNVTIPQATDNAVVRVTDALGALVGSYEFSPGGNYKIPFTSSSGVYYVSLILGDKNLVKKVIKK